MDTDLMIGSLWYMRIGKFKKIFIILKNYCRFRVVAIAEENRVHYIELDEDCHGKNTLACIISCSNYRRLA